MKIDGSQQVLHKTPYTRETQGNVTWTGRTEAPQGASFEKTKNQVLMEQAGRMKTEKEDNDFDSTARSRKNLDMLSNFVSRRDLEQMKEYTENLEEEEVEVIVTVVEKIKTQLTVYCDGYDSGMVDSLSGEQLKKISGDASQAARIAKKLAENNVPVTEDNITETMSAMEMYEHTGVLSDAAKEYCVKTGQEPTIENLYMAQHSGSYESGTGYYAQEAGYYAKMASDVNVDNLRPQIERLLKKEGMIADETMIQRAQWLVEKQLPVTKENLLKLTQLEAVSNQQVQGDESEALESIIEALLSGRRPAQANVIPGSVPVVGSREFKNIMERSVHAVEVVNQVKNSHLYYLTQSGQELTIENFTKAQEQNLDNLIIDEQDIQYITARRQLEEVRLQMTVDSYAAMIRNGINVETENMQALIEQLKHMEEQYYGQLLTANHVEATEQNVQLFTEVIRAKEQIARGPVDLLGTVAFAEKEMTVGEIREEAVALEEKYHQADQAYEACMTRPRKDMGDSIHKAFRNVDDILQDFGYECTEENRRAVRILGYNSLEITTENIQKVKAVDLEVNTMLNSMKPSAVIEMIREGYNPLDHTVQQVQEKVDSMRDDVATEQESYSEFLWNLEHSKGITEEERQAYIGIYRLMNQIEKTDGAVVGVLVEQGLPLTLRNMMMGIRTYKHKQMDYKIGDDQSVVTEKKIHTITDQIDQGYQYTKRLAGVVKNKMLNSDWGQIDHADEVMDMSVEAFLDYIQSVQQERQQADSYAGEQLREMEHACRTEEQILSFLESKDQALNVRNMVAATGLLKKRGSLFRDLADSVKNGDNPHLEQKLLADMEAVEEQFTDEISAKEAYNSLVNTMENVVEQNTLAEDITYEQMHTWKLLSNQIAMTKRLSGQSDYHIPVEIAGEYTAVHVQFVEKQGEHGKVAITLDSGVIGSFSAEFVQKDDVLDGYVVTDRREIKEKLLEKKDSLRSAVEKAGNMSVGTLECVEHQGVDLTKAEDEFSRSGSEQKVTGRELYQVAKAVIQFVKTALI